MNAKTYYSIQGLRALAALSVVLLHSGQIVLSRTGVPYEPFIAFDSGIDVFFIISGFVMVITTADKWGQPGASLPFLWRRIVRIVPLYWLITGLLLLSSRAHPSLTWYTVASFLFIPAWNSMHHMFPLLAMGWTLSFEMFFYLLFAIMLALQVRPVWWLSAVLAAASGMGLFFRDKGLAIATLLNPMLMEFVFGMWIGIAVLSRRFLPTRLILVAVPAMLLPMMVTSAMSAASALQFRLIFWGIPGAVLVWSAVSLEEQSHVVWKGLLSVLGDASYSIYLTHEFFLIPLGNIIAKHPLKGAFPIASLSVLCLVLPALAGVAIHYGVERPMTRLLRAKTWVRRESK